MYLLLGIGISNIAVINKFKELNIDFIVACKEEECKQAGEYSENVISYKMIKYINLDKIKFVIKSPGIPYHDKYLLYLKNKRIRIINEIELTYLLTSKKGIYIGVSGSVGKSSVVTLLYTQIRAITDNVILAGNIGDPLINYLDKIKDLD